MTMLNPKSHAKQTTKSQNKSIVTSKP